MTVTYTHEVANCTGFGCFWKLLFRWKGSIYKLVWPDLMLYTILYYALRFTYQFAFNDPQKRVFEQITLYCRQFTDLIPVSFILGFYVSIVVQRWWAQYETLPWPDPLATLVSTSIHGQDERSRLMRRTVMRYVNLSETLTLAMISPRVKKRFPTLDHLVESGFMHESEKKIFENLDLKTSHPKYWMPLVWAGTIVARARKEGRIRDDFAVKTIIDAINVFRGLCGGLLNYDWISIPLVYTQVVTLAVYSFFMGTLFGRQYLDLNGDDTMDLYVPWFSFLQFFFYMGWLKVAETLVNPFGEDDDDFEINWLIDRNLQVSYLIVDEMHSEYPELIQDKYWDEVFPQELPYTVATEQYRKEPPMGSTAFIEVPEDEQEFLPLLEEVDHSLENAVESAGSKTSRAIDIMKSDSMPAAAQSNLSSADVRRGAEIGRKPSLFVSFLNRITSKDDRRHRRRPTLKKVSASHASLNRRKSSSRISSTSQNSPNSILRHHTEDQSNQDSEIFYMSTESTQLCEKPLQPKPLVSFVSDDEGQIIIKIKTTNPKSDGDSRSTLIKPGLQSLDPTPSSPNSCRFCKKGISSQINEQSIDLALVDSGNSFPASQDGEKSQMTIEMPPEVAPAPLTSFRQRLQQRTFETQPIQIENLNNRTTGQPFGICSSPNPNQNLEQLRAWHQPNFYCHPTLAPTEGAALVSTESHRHSPSEVPKQFDCDDPGSFTDSTPLLGDTLKTIHEC